VVVAGVRCVVKCDVSVETKVQKWLETKQGRDTLQKAVTNATKVVQDYRKTREVDPAILRQPMTV
jgi:hypothetical protein